MRDKRHKEWAEGSLEGWTEGVANMCTSNGRQSAPIIFGA